MPPRPRARMAGPHASEAYVALGVAEILLPWWAEYDLAKQGDKHHKPLSDNNNGNNCGLGYTTRWRRRGFEVKVRLREVEENS